jgi:hypothetical protein
VRRLAPGDEEGRHPVLVLQLDLGPIEGERVELDGSGRPPGSSTFAMSITFVVVGLGPDRWRGAGPVQF